MPEYNDAIDDVIRLLDRQMSNLPSIFSDRERLAAEAVLARVGAQIRGLSQLKQGNT